MLRRELRERDLAQPRDQVEPNARLVRLIGGGPQRRPGGLLQPMQLKLARGLAFGSYRQAQRCVPLQLLELAPRLGLARAIDVPSRTVGEGDATHPALVIGSAIANEQSAITVCATFTHQPPAPTPARFARRRVLAR